MLRFSTLLISLALVAGCASTGSSGAPERQITATTGTNYDDNGLPGWVNRGSAAIIGETGRIFYGMGMAGGIKNPALLRMTADNRARAEVAKQFEVFTASLMKDYMDSTGDQQVEQAIKTLTKKSLKGSEIVDRYIDKDGTMYALAQVDLKRVETVIKQAEEMGAVKNHADDGSLEKLFDEMGKKTAAPAAPPVASGADVSGGAVGGATSRPSGDEEETRESRGGKPGWVDGYGSEFPHNKYLCGVGMGPQRPLAESGAYAALSRIFVARVDSASKDFMGAYTSSSSVPLETQSSESLTKISTDKLFSGVRIPEVWTADDGTVYALACLERAKASTILKEEIALKDDKAGRHLKNAARVDKAQRVAELSKALGTLVERAALNAELRIVDLRGIGAPGQYSHADVVAAFEAALDALKVGVMATGAHDSEFRTSLIAGLKKRGYTVLEDGSDPSLDILLKAKITVEDGGKGSGKASKIHFARAVIEIEVTNVQAKKVIGAFTETRKDGSRNFAEAARQAVRRLVKKITMKVSPKIDSAMKGL